MGTRQLRPKEIEGLCVPPGKAYTLLTDHLITGYQNYNASFTLAQLGIVQIFTSEAACTVRTKLISRFTQFL